MADPENLSSWQWLLIKDNSEVVRNYVILAVAVISFLFLILANMGCKQVREGRIETG